MASLAEQVVLVTGATDGLGRALDADSQAYDPQARRQLRELSEKLTGLA